jgi:hypothetical protein
MPKIKKTDDTAKLSAMTPGEVQPEAVESTVVSPAKEAVIESQEEPSESPVVMSLDDLDAFDPSATHEDYSEDDQFDDDDESF